MLDTLVVKIPGNTTVATPDREYPCFSISNKDILVPYFAVRDKTEIVIKDERPQGAKRGHKFNGELSFRQAETVSELTELIKHDHSAILHAKPGAGKTVMALYMACMLDTWPVTVLVDSKYLLMQWIQRIREFVPTASISVISPKELKKSIEEASGLKFPLPRKVVDMSGDFVIGLLQTIYRQKSTIKTGLVISDETHIVPAYTFSQCMYKISSEKGLGLSATEERRDKTM